MDSTFVRKDFYIDPPAEGSTPDVWAEWLKADRREAIKAKAAYTRSQKAGEMPDSMQQSAMRKVNGVWKATTPIAFVGSVEDGTGSLEPAVEATQERDLLRSKIIDAPRGLSHKLTHIQNHKARKAVRQSKNSHFANLRRKGKLA